MLKQFGTFTEEIISVYTRQILLGLSRRGRGDSGRADTDAPLASWPGHQLASTPSRSAGRCMRAGECTTRLYALCEGAQPD